MKELFRRLVLVGCLLTAGSLAYVASLAPLISWRYIDFVADLENDRAAYRALKDMSADNGGYTEKRLSEISDGLSAESVEQYAAEKIGRDRVLTLEGRQWESLARNIIDVSIGKNKDRSWTRRFPSEQHHLGDIFFEEGEPPVNELLPYFETSPDPIYIRVESGNELHYFKAVFHRYSKDQFSMFGFSASPRPPSSFFYPFRPAAFWIFLAGLAVYLLLPRAELKEGVLAYPRYLVFLGDLAALVCTFPFFILPFMIVGSFERAFVEAWPVMAALWIIMGIGLYLFKISAYYASYRLEIAEDGLIVSALNGREQYPFSSISCFQPVVFKAPKWLIVLMWLAALSGKGAAGAGAAGRAMMLQGSEYGAIGIQLESGRSLYINITNALGGAVLKGSEAIPEALRKAGVKERTEVMTIRSLGLETMKIPRR